MGNTPGKRSRSANQIVFRVGPEKPTKLELQYWNIFLLRYADGKHRTTLCVGDSSFCNTELC